ncbi:MAG: hypothetical protein TQ37_04250 [Candidatus Synechococcus spongiarum 15L]|uniref:Uncharacterized protein n=2 Tax=Candidatus Synechococcus spongiarum TaxID=431041 RepID=A0A1T1CB95_9SYNE|nr:MAG: hypothetical protein TQ37_04250 [Candidatus Synechococcus spongiarum 15L]OOV25743.1 hypothetical protein BV61_06860 [Candidatus Synechococcus spongiarum LMB bulk15M]
MLTHPAGRTAFRSDATTSSWTLLPAHGFSAFGGRLTIAISLELALFSDSTTYTLLWALAHSHRIQPDPWQLSLEWQRQEQIFAVLLSIVP